MIALPVRSIVPKLDINIFFLFMQKKGSYRKVMYAKNKNKSL